MINLLQGRRLVAKLRLQMGEELKRRMELARKKEEANRLKAIEAAKKVSLFLHV